MPLPVLSARRITVLTLGLGSSMALTAHTQALNVNFDFTYDTGTYQAADGSNVTGFFTRGVTYQDGSTGDQRRAALEAAASVYENAFSDTLTAITPTGGINSYNAIINNPSGDGTITLSNLALQQNEVRVYVGAEDVNAAAFAGPGGAQVFQNTQFGSNVLSRGQGNTTGSDATDYSLWGGSVTFDSNLSASGFNFDWHWNTENTTGLTTSHVDFLSVAIHELGHVFGFGLADSFKNKVVEINGEKFFNGANAVAAFGGQLVPLDSIAGHFREGLLNNSLNLDPTITVGDRNLLQALDYAVFADIGWQVNPAVLSAAVAVPTPTAAFSIYSMLSLLLFKRRTPKPQVQTI